MTNTVIILICNIDCSAVWPFISFYYKMMRINKVLKFQYFVSFCLFACSYQLQTVELNYYFPALYYHFSGQTMQDLKVINKDTSEKAHYIYLFNV